MGPLQSVKLTEKASEIVSGTNEKVVETVGSVTESVTGVGAEVTADVVTVASEVVTAVKETVEDTIHIAKDAIDAGKDKTLEGAVSQMVKVLKISVYQLVDEGFTKATVSSGVNVMGVVNLNVSVHLEEQMAVHFKRLEEKEKRKHKRDKAAKAAARNGSSTPSAATPTSPATSTPTPTSPPPTAKAFPTIIPDHNEVSVEVKKLREKKKEKRPAKATELIQRIIEGDEAALTENAETHRHDVHEHRDCAPTPPVGKASRAVAQKKEAHVAPPAAVPNAGRGRGKRAVAPKVVDDTPGSSTSE
ncbi:uncharacterized protein ACA1_325240 [Acanthamoeba castellanii str. Neff]|uniref:Uncharacterized protein n=1 Tax=Acanthamoeba castellanii (strain ATCC 30010 / Neff) TaxID=1257118 RepID=L8GQH3_ACACF|nr:uncharacterized protein ACA1_325240 [Acanthamoeba castellanii str. Neff]ELR14908.1 hypothetical protein ACA1_325240 [Acanthamoeba castellanii str. Neff]